MEDKKLTDDQIITAAKKLNIEPAMIKAFAEVESAGNGFLNDGRPKILFEGHIFYKLLIKYGFNPMQYEKGNEEVLYEKWDKSKYFGGEYEYVRLEKAKKINEEIALMSASWGMFQIMGFNYRLCEYVTINDFVLDMYKNEEKHLQAVMLFLKNRGIIDHLMKKAFSFIALDYNGPRFYENKYHEKLKTAYEKYIYLNNK